MKGLKMMKRIILILLAVCMATINTEAKSRKAPKSALKGVYYRISGGMNPYDAAYANLRREKDGNLKLTLLGDCAGETITLEVGDSVLEHCQQLILKSKLYKSEGHYKAPGDFVVYDAPSTSFDAFYENREESFDAGGWIPSGIRDGIEEIYSYLKSLRGDRQAPGHVKILRHVRAAPEGSFTNGEIVFTPDDAGIEELYQFLAKKYGIHYDYSDWNCDLAEGSGLRAIIIRAGHFMEVFNDVKTAGHTVKPDHVFDICPEVSQRLLTRADIAGFSSEKTHAITEAVRSHYSVTENPTDVERQNLDMMYYMGLWNQDHQKE